MPIDTTDYNRDGDLGSTPVTLELILRLNKDIKKNVHNINPGEARYLVDLYYSLQRLRISTGNASKAMEKSEESNVLLDFFQKQTTLLENQVQSALDAYTGALQVGIWARRAKGVGPVITAGILAHVDIRKAPTVGSIYQYAGHNPTVKWEKGQKRPWNAKLKVLLWKMGESYVKVSNREGAHYGRLYRFRKAMEMARNARGDYAEAAARALTEKNYRKETKTKELYEKGFLPPAQLHLRATRWAVQIYLSHLHSVWYYLEHNTMPPRPYVFSHMDHVDFMMPPHMEGMDNLTELELGLRKMFPGAVTIDQWINKHAKHYNLDLNSKDLDVGVEEHDNL